jgi:hypothetical protein
LIFNVIGKPSLDEIMFSIRDSFPKYQPKNVMWDLSNAFLHVVDFEFISKVSGATQEMFPYRTPGGRTAIVVSDPSEVLLLKVYTSMTSLSGAPSEYKLFESRSDALDWISERAS